MRLPASQIRRIPKLAALGPESWCPRLCLTVPERRPLRRGDVYSLGVLLYELLTGTTPIESTRLRDAGYSEIERLIREVEPPRPSTRLGALGDSATLVAGNRATDPKRLCRLLTGDLDWIAMKALEKDPNRRYA